MSASISSSVRAHARFCGIDVGKSKHVACIIDHQGTQIVRTQSFNNHAQGFQRILQRLQEAGGPQQVAIGMEATGHYWYNLHECLVGQQYQVAVLNPLQTSRQAAHGIRKTQTDRIDAHHIAVLIKNGEYRPAIIPDELGMTCRRLTRLHRTMRRQEARIKQLLWAWIHPAWPEYEPLFANPFCKTSQALLNAAPTPRNLLDMPPDTLTELLRKTSRGRYGPRKADQVRQAAENSVGMQRGSDAARLGIRLQLAQLEALRLIREQLQDEIETLAGRLPDYLLTLPGASTISVVSLFGETDPFHSFTSPDKLIAFAGLDVVVSQSGQYENPRRHISKRGSPFLRCTLWNMAHRACYQEGHLRDYWLRKKARGLPHLSAVTAVAVKLCPVVWRIMTDHRPYLPQRPTTKP